MTSSNLCYTRSDISYCIWLYLCGKQVSCGTSEIGSEFGLSVYQARYYLLQLCRENKVRRLLSGRGRPALWLGVKSPSTLDCIMSVVK
ncbi:hypothetical protein GO150_003560 [Salmonella enterica subsp. diarizonae]|uniref:Dolichol monophosphate mannose synthase n=1 Tax=Salmonella enteritidis TaxID=149539 RepID=A0A3R0QZ31_SALEN|nr:hypothetical protein [Salmonella enterica subsp. diarizonae]EED4924940.1 hypothetical protein [Salmonella enterica subsp. arizonae]EGX4307676.1 hypothetical protein [Salmonella enterica]MJY20970.1 hypothetical protein [Salmonella enterica subsp. enterica serovar Enteritidis]ECO0585774.1 hypothetical protein [Salmonella enterica subsp. diarizonae]